MHINIAKVDFGRCYSGSGGGGGGEVEYYGMYVTPADASAINVTPNDSYYTLHGKYLKYSFDDKTWNDWNGGVSIEPGQKMYVKGEDDYVWTSSTYGKLITSTSYYNVGGDISSLTNFNTEVKEYTFNKLFYEDSYIKDASSLIMPATTLAANCYRAMFRGCTSLTQVPELPATTLANSCYKYMFRDCTSLTTAPELPATTLASSCYGGMFYGCTSLTQVPELPATTLVESCYESMFQGCTSLTTAPELPATKLINYCYQYMFEGCSKLNNITMLATNIPTSDCLLYWVSGVSSTGTFTKAASMTTLPTGASGIPSGWTVVNK